MKIASAIIVLFASAAIAADADILLRRKAKAHDGVEAISIFDQAVLEKHLLGNRRKTEVPEVRSAREEVPLFQAYFYTAEWCGPCQYVKSGFGWLEKSGWRIGTKGTEHVVIVDETNGSSGAVAGYPTVVITKNGKEVTRRTVASAQDLVTFYNSTVEKYADSPMAKSSK